MFKLVSSLLMVISLAGCGTTTYSLIEAKNPHQNHSSSEQTRCCGCKPDMSECGRNADGSTCCTPSSCKCSQITAK